MADQRTVFGHDTIATPEWANAITRPVYRQVPELDGEIKPPTREELLDVDTALDSLETSMEALAGVNDALVGLDARLDKAVSFHQSFISALSPVAMTAGVQAILESDDLPIGSYVVSGNAVATLPAGGISNLIIRAGLHPTAGDLPDESFGNHFQWEGTMGFRMISLPVTPRVISLASLGKIRLNAQCTNFGSTIAGTWTGSLLILPLPT